MAVQDLGKVVGDNGTSVRNRGEWNAVAQYVNDAQYMDMVSHKGKLWSCLATNTNVEPARGKEQWNLSAEGGEKLVTLEQVNLVTEPGFYVDAMAVKELNRNINRSTYISVTKDAAVNVIFAVSVQSGRCPIVIYGTAAGNIPFAFMVPFNNPTSTLTSLEKVYMIKDSSLDLLNLSIIAESGNYRMKFVNNTGNGLDMYITIGHTSAQVIKVS